MSKTIRFLGGPKDQELRAVEDDITRVEFCELPEITKVPSNHRVALIHHVYLEAFKNAPYFKYQGIENIDVEFAPFPKDFVLEF